MFMGIFQINVWATAWLLQQSQASYRNVAEFIRVTWQRERILGDDGPKSEHLN